MGYGGAAWTLRRTEHGSSVTCVPDFNAVAGPCNGSWDDCISSVRIPDPWLVTPFPDDNFGV